MIMKYCVKCGNQLKNKENTCPNCGYGTLDKKELNRKKKKSVYPKVYCTKCGGTLSKNTFLCTYCGCFSIGKKTIKNPNDKINLGLCLVAFLCPLFGLIYWPVKHKELPEKAQAVGVMAVVSLALVYATSIGFPLFFR